MVDYALDYTQSTLWKRRGYTKSNIYIRKNRKALDLIRSLPPLKKKVISSNKHKLKTSINNTIDTKYAGRSLRRSSQVLHKIHKYETLSNQDNKRTLYKKYYKKKVKALSPTEFNFNI